MRILRFGSTGPAVQLLQLALNRADFGSLETDGVFGPATRGALSRFQSVHGLAVDAVAGPATHRALTPWYTGYVSRRVQRGDSFFSLARLYGSTPEAIALANPDAAAERLQIGQRLVIPLPFDVVPTELAWFAALVGCCVQGLTARYPFLRSGQIGRSVMGKPLWSLSLGQGENRVLYNAEHHANEWLTTPLLLRYAEELAQRFAEGGSIAGVSAAELLDYAELCLIPAVNPDGMDLVTGELRAGEYYDAARAISRNYPQFPFPSGWKANIRGVDPNLQYPALWERAREIKFSQGIVSPAPADYVGPAPLSAPEPRALHRFTRRFDPALVLAYHSQGEVIYWQFQELEPAGAEQIAELFSDLSGYAVETVPYDSGFAGYKDWFLQDYGRPGYTIEAGRGVNPLPVADFPEIYRRNRGLLTAAAMVT